MGTLMTWMYWTVGLATQVDPNQGTNMARLGAKQRIEAPSYYDAMFPIIGFFLVIVLPSLTVLWVIYKTLTETDKEEGES